MRGRAAAAVAAAAGTLAGQPGVGGVRVLSAARQGTFIGWPAVVSTALDDANRTIVLRGAWSRLGWIVCTDDTYAAAKERVEAKLAQSVRADTQKRCNPLFAYGLWSLVIVGAAFPLFRVPYPYELEFFVLTTLAFALAGLWLVPLLAWGAAPGLAYAFFVLAPSLAREADHPSSSDFVAVALGFAGALVLAFVCYRLVRGALPSALMIFADAAGSENLGRMTERQQRRFTPRCGSILRRCSGDWRYRRNARSKRGTCYQTCAYDDLDPTEI